MSGTADHDAQNPGAAIGRAERMAERRPRIVAVFGEVTADTVIGVLTLTELAWHDCRSAKLAVEDSRDLMVWAAELRSQRR